VRFLTLVGIAVVERLAGWPPLLAIADAPRPVMMANGIKSASLEIIWQS